MRIVLVVVMLCACGSVQRDTVDAGPTEDAAVAGDAEGCATWTTRGGHVMGDPCALPQSASWRIGVAGGVYNTDDGTYTAGPAPQSALLAVSGLINVRVVSVADFSVSENASLRVIGKHPLLVVSQSTIVVAGTIDVSSQRALGSGAGANLAGCQGATAGQGTANSGGGGGGGFKTAGGSGGPGNATPPPAGGIGGAALARPVGFVRGGCPGARGSADSTGGAGGSGGGAIQLTAKTSLTIAATGRIVAGGAGGSGNSNRGGGGAGSGGFVGLDAPRVEAMAGSIVAANGGGGASSCEFGGVSGEDGKLADAPARGGSGCTFTDAPGGAGGFRGAGAVNGASGIGTSGDNGGGGGGGGVGYIIVWAPPGAFLTGGLQTPAVDYITQLERRP